MRDLTAVVVTGGDAIPPAVLGELQDRAGDDSFADHVFAISGVSGGSLGASVFAALVGVSMPTFYSAMLLILVFSILLRWIPDATRQWGTDAAWRAWEAAAACGRGLGVVGFGLGGDETSGSAEDFADLFAEVRAEGLGVTIHAGEVPAMDRAADSVRQAVEADPSLTVYFATGARQGLSGYYTSGVIEGAYHYGLFADR